MIGAGEVVCVTGASGYIASWVVKLLLHRGYTVKATVRNPNDLKKVQHLRCIDGAKDRLQLFPANLLEEASFDAAVQGCVAVFHTASPFYYDVNDPQVELLDPAVKGTLNVLDSCAKVPTVKKVVLTSSIAAVAYNGKPRTPDVVVDESWFSNPALCRESKVCGDAMRFPIGECRQNLTLSCRCPQMWYVLSKTLAEDAAWKFVKEKGIEMVTINPAMVIGPLLQPTLNTSAAAVAKLFGAETYPNASFGWVHVKDVAMAHILAFEVPSANGRYCLVESVAHFSDVVKILKELYPNATLPDKCADDKPFVPPYQVSKEKVTSLGIDYIPLKVCFKETVESLKEKGFVSL